VEPRDKERVVNRQVCSEADQPIEVSLAAPPLKRRLRGDPRPHLHTSSHEKPVEEVEARREGPRSECPNVGNLPAKLLEERTLERHAIVPGQ
jgi:hypothetical protein